MGVLESYGKQAQPGSRPEREGGPDNAVADPDFLPAGS